jgi:hypothetical protein
MVVRYSGHMVRTRPQAAWLGALMLSALLPLIVWRALTQPVLVSMALAMLAMAPFAIAYQAWRFLAEQERVHAEPTPGMLFAFRFLANTPLTFGALLIVLLLTIE